MTDFGGNVSNRTFAERILREVRTIVSGAASTSFVTGISGLPLASSVTATNRFPLVTSAGVGYRATATLIRDYVLGISGGLATIPENVTAPTIIASTRLTAPLIGTTTAVDVVFGRNSVTQLTLGSLLATFAGAVTVTTNATVTGLAGVGTRMVTASAAGLLGVAAIPTGDVVGPASATDNAVALYDGTTGKLLKNSVVIANAGAMTGITTITATGQYLNTLITEQMRLRYDASNYFGVTVNSTGNVALAAVGSSPSFTFAQLAQFNTDSATPITVGSATTTVGGSRIGIDMTISGNAASGTHADITGIQVVSRHLNSGSTTTNVRGLYSIVSRVAGTVTNGVGLDIAAISSAMTTAYGIRIGNITGGGTNYVLDAGTGIARFGDVVNINSANGLQVQGNKVMGARGAAVADAAGGVVIDAECRAQVAALSARFRVTGGHGAIAD